MPLLFEYTTDFPINKILIKNLEETREVQSLVLLDPEKVILSETNTKLTDFV